LGNRRLCRFVDDFFVQGIFLPTPRGICAGCVVKPWRPLSLHRLARMVRLLRRHAPAKLSNVSSSIYKLQ